MEIEAPGDGVLAAISAQPGNDIPVGRTIAWIVQPGEAPPIEVAQATTGRRLTSDTAATTSLLAKAIPKLAVELRVSPKARRLAKEQGVDLAKLKGSGPEGEIVAADVMAAAGATSAPAPVATYGPVSSMAKLMAKRVTESWTTVPHFHVIRHVDASAIQTSREHHAGVVEQSHKTKLTITDLLIAIIARTLTRHPDMNASWIDGCVRHNPEINVSVAIAVEDGVVAPVIHNADRLGLGEISALRRDLSERARAAKLRPADITGGSFTISNLGMFDVDEFTAIIAPPQAAILAIGRIGDRVVPINGKPAVRPVMTMTLSSDHRIVDGARAALFMRDLVTSILAS
jgi:pyruvate dehydrogenase E2 component (dihydrolipoamide acetyltransferase)